jgi:MFS family permease
MLMLRAQLLVATLWVGSLWTIGYVVAPTLFSTLSDRVLAGTIAARLFRVEAWLSVGCAAVLMALVLLGNAADHLRRRKVLLAIVAAMLACTLVGYFGLQPMMAALREAAGPTGVMESAERTKFGILHGISAAIYLVQSLLGVALVLKLGGGR